jgi:hypothetical protein
MHHLRSSPVIQQIITMAPPELEKHAAGIATKRALLTQEKSTTKL